MQIGTTKDQGLYNKPSAAVHPGAIAAGTLQQYNTKIKRAYVALIYIYISMDSPLEKKFWSYKVI